LFEKADAVIAHNANFDIHVRNRAVDLQSFPLNWLKFG